MISLITITHTRTEGTLATGTAEDDGSAEILSGYAFRWLAALGSWGLADTQDSAPSWRIGHAARALRAAGFDVSTEITNEPRWTRAEVAAAYCTTDADASPTGSDTTPAVARPAITITHSRADGTLAESDEYIPEDALAILKAWPGNFRWFPRVRQYGVRNTRDKAAATWKLERVAESLRAAGFEVAIEITEDERRAFAEIEAERNARADERAEHRTELAEKREAEAEAAYDASNRAVEGIPMGQPVLVGHHSQRRHEKALERSRNQLSKSVELSKTARYHAGRAEAAANYQQHREDIPTTLRRIERLEAEERRIVRGLFNAKAGRSYGGSVPQDHTPEQVEEISGNLAEVREELEYWRAHVAAAEAAGLKLWSRADFQKGDWVKHRDGWDLVERVNPKSLSLPTEPGWNQRKLSYSDVLDRLSPEEMEAARAAAKARKEAAAAEQAAQQ